MSACQSTSPGGPPRETAELDPATPMALVQRAQAARGRQAAILLMQAAEAYGRLADWTAAQTTLQEIDHETLDPAEQFDLHLAVLRTAIRLQQPEQAQAAWDTATLEATNQRRLRGSAYYPLTSELCELLRRYRCAFDALVRYQPDPAERQAVHDRLWTLLSYVDTNTTPALAGSEQDGWWQLKLAMTTSFSVHEQRDRLAAWTERWPNHPFAVLPPTGLARLQLPAWAPRRIALMVPLSGSLAPAGRAVRDGFIAAYLHDSTPNKPHIKIYDTAGTPTPQLYEQSLVDGVELIVGPLSKQNLRTMADLNPEVPVLGLNYLDGTSPASLRQLGLAIEDEASTIIDRLLVDARERVLVVHNEEDWALRGARTVTAAWPFSIESQSFADIKTIPEAIGAAMRVTASQTRRQELSDLLGEQLEFLPRARSDLDGVVAFVSHIEAAALVPALRFHFGDHLPVYASSQSARTTDGLSELDGFHISAMPFNLDEDALASSLKQNFDVAGSNVGALYALGIDAYRVSDRWQHFAIENDQIYGSTGRLRLDADGRIRRTLMWGLVSGGQLTPAL